MSGPPLRLAAVSDIQGDWDSLAAIAAEQHASYIVHTGNFGFWNPTTAQRGADLAYLKQIVAFLAVLPRSLVAELNDLSVINGNASSGPDIDGEKAITEAYQNVLRKPNMLSHMDAYLAGTKQLPCPVYTIIGPLDDPAIVEKFLLGVYHVPNLYIVDHKRAYTLTGEGPNIRIYGLGGNLKVHSLFDSGSLDSELETASDSDDSDSLEVPIKSGDLCGRTGDLWVTLLQVARLYLNAHKEKPLERTVNVFLTHLPVVKTPLLEHLAIITGADVTVSQGLHFRYPVLGNGMSFVDSMGGSAGYIENYRSKFSRLRMILGELWLAIKNDVSKLLEDDAELRQLIELGLSLFDKIPVTISESVDKIVKLSLEETDEDDEENIEISKLTLKKINDMYFSAYYKLWHFNLCDHLITDDLEPEDLDSSDHDGPPEFNVMVFSLDRKGYFRLVHCNSQGFNFLSIRDVPEEEDDDEQMEYEDDISEENSSDKQDESLRRTKELLNSTYKDYRARGRGRGRGRSRGGVKRGRSTRAV